MAATVLVVDDEISQLQLLSRWLAEFACPCRLAASARVALEEMAANPADILLVDLIMPEHDGFWLIERVRTQWPRSVIIVATGTQDLDAVENAKRLGAVDYVTKPFGRELLHQSLQRAEQKLAALRIDQRHE
jgi:two-component system, NtrC family, response regulator HydG